jgi:hypothetical protein
MEADPHNVIAIHCKGGKGAWLLHVFNPLCVTGSLRAHGYVHLRVAAVLRAV